MGTTYSTNSDEMSSSDTNETLAVLKDDVATKVMAAECNFRINFQPFRVRPLEGFLSDGGKSLDRNKIVTLKGAITGSLSRIRYGWDEDSRAYFVDRRREMQEWPAAPSGSDPRLSTLGHLRGGGGGAKARHWFRVELPNGIYRCRITVGDLSLPSENPRLRIETFESGENVSLPQILRAGEIHTADVRVIVRQNFFRLVCGSSSEDIENSVRLISIDVSSESGTWDDLRNRVVTASPPLYAKEQDEEIFDVDEFVTSWRRLSRQAPRLRLVGANGDSWPGLILTPSKSSDGDDTGIITYESSFLCKKSGPVMILNDDYRRRFINIKTALDTSIVEMTGTVFVDHTMTSDRGTRLLHRSEQDHVVIPESMVGKVVRIRAQYGISKPSNVRIVLPKTFKWQVDLGGEWKDHEMSTAIENAFEILESGEKGAPTELTYRRRSGGHPMIDTSTTYRVDVANRVQINSTSQNRRTLRRVEIETSRQDRRRHRGIFLHATVSIVPAPGNESEVDETETEADDALREWVSRSANVILPSPEALSLFHRIRCQKDISCSEASAALVRERVRRRRVVARCDDSIETGAESKRAVVAEAGTKERDEEEGAGEASSPALPSPLDTMTTEMPMNVPSLFFASVVLDRAHDASFVRSLMSGICDSVVLSLLYGQNVTSDVDESVAETAALALRAGILPTSSKIAEVEREIYRSSIGCVDLDVPAITKYLLRRTTPVYPLLLGALSTRRVVLARVARDEIRPLLDADGTLVPAAQVDAKFWFQVQLSKLSTAFRTMTCEENEDPNVARIRRIFHRAVVYSPLEKEGRPVQGGVECEAIKKLHALFTDIGKKKRKRVFKITRRNRSRTCGTEDAEGLLRELGFQNDPKGGASLVLRLESKSTKRKVVEKAAEYRTFINRFRNEKETKEWIRNHVERNMLFVLLCPLLSQTEQDRVDAVGDFRKLVRRIVSFAMLSTRTKKMVDDCKSEMDNKTILQDASSARVARSVLRMLIALYSVAADVASSADRSSVQCERAQTYLATLVDEIFLATTRAVDEASKSEDAFSATFEVEKCASLVSSACDSIALMCVRGCCKRFLRAVLPRLSDVLSSIERYRTSKAVERSFDLANRTIASVEAVDDSRIVSNVLKRVPDFSAMSRAQKGFWWVYKPRPGDVLGSSTSSEDEDLVAFPPTANDELENAWSNINWLDVDEVQEAGSLFYFDFMGDRAIALMSTRVPPGTGLETIRVYRSCWGLHAKDGRHLYRLEGAAARDAELAARSCNSDVQALFRAGSSVRSTAIEGKHEFPSIADARGRFTEDFVFDEAVKCQRVDALKVSPSRACDISGNIPRALWLMADVADASSCITTVFICGDPQIPDERFVSSQYLERSPIFRNGMLPMRFVDGAKAVESAKGNEDDDVGPKGESDIEITSDLWIRDSPDGPPSSLEKKRDQNCSGARCGVVSFRRTILAIASIDDEGSDVSNEAFDRVWDRTEAMLKSHSRKLKKNRMKRHPSLERAYVASLLWHTQSADLDSFCSWFCDAVSSKASSSTASASTKRSSEKIMKEVGNRLHLMRKNMHKLAQDCVDESKLPAESRYEKRSLSLKELVARNAARAKFLLEISPTNITDKDSLLSNAQRKESSASSSDMAVDSGKSKMSHLWSLMRITKRLRKRVANRKGTDIENPIAKRRSMVWKHVHKYIVNGFVAPPNFSGAHSKRSTAAVESTDVDGGGGSSKSLEGESNRSSLAERSSVVATSATTLAVSSRPTSNSEGQAKRGGTIHPLSCLDGCTGQDRAGVCRAFADLYSHTVYLLRKHSTSGGEIALVEWLLWCWAVDFRPSDAEFILSSKFVPLVISSIDSSRPLTNAGDRRWRKIENEWRRWPLPVVRGALLTGQISKSDLVAHIRKGTDAILSPSNAVVNSICDQSAILTDEDDELVASLVCRDPVQLTMRLAAIQEKEAQFAVLIFYDPSRKRCRQMIANIAKIFQEDSITVVAVTSDSAEICRNFGVTQYPTVIIPDRRRPDRRRYEGREHVSEEIVERAIREVLSNHEGGGEPVEVDSSVRRAEDTVPAAAAKDDGDEDNMDTVDVCELTPLEKWREAHAKEIFSNGESELDASMRHTKVKLIEIYESFLRAASLSLKQMSDDDDGGGALDDSSRVFFTDHLVPLGSKASTSEDGSTFLADRPRNAAQRYERSARLLIRALSLTMFSKRHSLDAKACGSTYSPSSIMPYDSSVLELECATFTIVLHKLRSAAKLLSESSCATSTSSILAEREMFFQLRWLLSLAHTRGCRLHLSRPSILSLLFSLGFGEICATVILENNERSQTTMVVRSRRVARLSLRLIRHVLCVTSPSETLAAMELGLPSLVASCRRVSESPSTRSRKKFGGASATREKMDDDRAACVIRVLLRCAGGALLPPKAADVAISLNSFCISSLSKILNEFKDIRHNTKKKKTRPKLEPVPKEREEMVVAMGFTQYQARVALRCNRNRVQEAIDWILRHDRASKVFIEAAEMYGDRDDDEQDEDDEVDSKSTGANECSTKEIEKNSSGEIVQDVVSQRSLLSGVGISMRAIGSEIVMILRSLVQKRTYDGDQLSFPERIEGRRQIWRTSCRKQLGIALRQCPSDISSPEDDDDLALYATQMCRASVACGALAAMSAGWDLLRPGGRVHLIKNDTDALVLNVSPGYQRSARRDGTTIRKGEYTVVESGNVTVMFEGKSTLASSMTRSDVVPIDELKPPMSCASKLAPFILLLSRRIMNSKSVALTTRADPMNLEQGPYQAAGALAMATIRAFCARALQSTLQDPKIAKDVLTGDVVPLLLSVASQSASEPQLLSLRSLERRAQRLVGRIVEASDSCRIHHVDPPLPSLDNFRAEKSKEEATTEELHRKALAQELVVFVPESVKLAYADKLRLAVKALELKGDRSDVASAWLQTEALGFVMSGKLADDESGDHENKRVRDLREKASTIAGILQLPPGLCFRALRLWDGDSNVVINFLSDNRKLFLENEVETSEEISFEIEQQAMFGVQKVSDKDVGGGIKSNDEEIRNAEPESLQNLLGIRAGEGDSRSLLREMRARSSDENASTTASAASATTSGSSRSGGTRHDTQESSNASRRRRRESDADETEDDGDEDDVSLDENEERNDRDTSELCELHFVSLVGDGSPSALGAVCSDSMYSDGAFVVPHQVALLPGTPAYRILESTSKANVSVVPVVIVRVLRDSKRELWRPASQVNVKVGDFVRVRDVSSLNRRHRRRHAQEEHLSVGDVGFVTRLSDRIEADSGPFGGREDEIRGNFVSIRLVNSSSDSNHKFPVNDIEVAAPCRVLIRCFDQESGRVSDMTVSQTEIRVAVRAYGVPIHDGSALLWRTAAANEAIGLAYVRLALVRLLRAAKRKSDETKEELVSPSFLSRSSSSESLSRSSSSEVLNLRAATRLTKTTSQIVCRNSSAEFQPMANAIFGDVIFPDIADGGVGVTATERSLFGCASKKKESTTEERKQVRTKLLLLLRLFASSQDEFSRSAPSFSPTMLLAHSSRLGIIPSEAGAMVTFVESMTRLLRKDDALALSEALVEAASRSLMLSTQPGNALRSLDKVTAESLHPYWPKAGPRGRGDSRNPLDGEYGEIDVGCAGSYWIVFDRRSSTAKKDAELVFYTDAKRSRVVAKTSGPAPWRPIVVTLPSKTLYWSFDPRHRFQRSASNPWGWRFQVRPLRGQSWISEASASSNEPSLVWSCWLLEYLMSIAKSDTGLGSADRTHRVFVSLLSYFSARGAPGKMRVVGLLGRILRAAGNDGKAIVRYEALRPLERVIMRYCASENSKSRIFLPRAVQRVVGIVIVAREIAQCAMSPSAALYIRRYSDMDMFLADLFSKDVKSLRGNFSTEMLEMSSEDEGEREEDNSLSFLNVGHGASFNHSPSPPYTPSSPSNDTASESFSAPALRDLSTSAALASGDDDHGGVTDSDDDTPRSDDDDDEGDDDDDDDDLLAQALALSRGLLPEESKNEAVDGEVDSKDNILGGGAKKAPPRAFEKARVGPTFSQRFPLPSLKDDLSGCLVTVSRAAECFLTKKMNDRSPAFGDAASSASSKQDERRNILPASLVAAAVDKTYPEIEFSGPLLRQTSPHAPRSAGFVHLPKAKSGEGKDSSFLIPKDTPNLDSTRFFCYSSLVEASKRSVKMRKKTFADVGEPIVVELSFPRPVAILSCIVRAVHGTKFRDGRSRIELWDEENGKWVDVARSEVGHLMPPTAEHLGGKPPSAKKRAHPFSIAFRPQCDDREKSRYARRWRLYDLSIQTAWDHALLPVSGGGEGTKKETPCRVIAVNDSDGSTDVVRAGSRELCSVMNVPSARVKKGSGVGNSVDQDHGGIWVVWKNESHTVEETLAMKRAVRGALDPWSSYEDAALVRLATQRAEKHQENGKSCPIQTRELRPACFSSIGESDRLTFFMLTSVSVESLRLRLAILQIWNAILRRVLPMVDLSDDDAMNSKTDNVTRRVGLGANLRQLKGSILMETKKRVLRAAIKATKRKSGRPLPLKLDRKKAKRAISSSGDAKGTNEGETESTQKKDSSSNDISQSTCLFAQALHILANPDLAKAFRGTPQDSQLMSVDYKDEDGVDAGGLYNDMMTAFVEDELFPIEGTVLSLFLRTPNAVLGDVLFVPNPSIRTPTGLKAYRAVGRLLGIALRTQLCQHFRLAPFVWECLTGYADAKPEPMRGESVRVENRALQLLGEIDERVAEQLRKIRYCNDESEFGTLVEYDDFSVSGADFQKVSLLDDADQRLVTFKERRLYVRMALQHRMHEFDTQIKAMQSGLFEILPERVVRLLSGRDLEMFVCGDPEIDVELLKENTEYSGPRNWGPNHPAVKMFWEIFENYSQIERAKTLRFIWARETLPRRDVWPKLEKRKNTFKLTYRGGGDDTLPISHTCFFQLDWPEFSSKAKGKWALDLAITEGRDFNLR
eukprot:g1550.t1